MIRVPGCQFALENSRLFVRALSTNSGQNPHPKIKFNPRITFLFLAVVGGASLYPSVRQRMPNEYGRPPFTPVDEE